MAITVQKCSEEELRRQARLIDLSPTATIVRKLDGTITFWSKGAERLYGWPRHEAIGQLAADLIGTELPQDFAAISGQLEAGRSWSGEVRQRTRDGRLLSIQSHWVAEVDASGKVTDILESNTDITEIKRLQEHLEEMVQERTARLQETNAELEAFSYSLSHDMRGPLRAILGFAEFARQDCGEQLGETGRDYLDKITAAAERLERLIRDVLDFTRISRGKLSLVRIDLDRLVRAVIEGQPEFKPPAADIRIEGKLPAVLAQETLLTQIVMNLLGNAVKFVGHGVKPNIRIHAQERGGRVRLWVDDNGIGVSRHARERIFHVFQREQKTADYEGTGIGLAVVRKAAQRMGGSAGVESEPGKGSRFWVDLPAGGDAAEAAAVGARLATIGEI